MAAPGQIYRLCLMGIKGQQSIIIETFLEAFDQRMFQFSRCCQTGWNMLNMADLVAITG
jgi:hypothetical protein